MADRIDGALYYERAGRSGPVMAFVHPNPMDQSCWLYQMAHFSTWHRCIAIDIPGYGRSPVAAEGLRVEDLTQAIWETLDAAFPNEPAILVGCSVGADLVIRMATEQPARAAWPIATITRSKISVRHTGRTNWRAISPTFLPNVTTMPMYRRSFGSSKPSSRLPPTIMVVSLVP